MVGAAELSDGVVGLVDMLFRLQRLTGRLMDYTTASSIGYSFEAREYLLDCGKVMILEIFVKLDN